MFYTTVHLPLLTDTGKIAKDTVIEDPLMTVPIHAPNFPGDVSLCYQVHGEPSKIFNLVSDECTSVNAHYVKAPITGDYNIIQTVSVLAVDKQGYCNQISVTVDANSCTARVNEDVLQGDGTARKRGTTITSYEQDGIAVRAYESRVRISVPNCADNKLVMWVKCVHEPLFDYDGEETAAVNMIRFEIIRGLNLKEYSHGLLGNYILELIPVSLAFHVIHPSFQGNSGIFP